ncbi:MAG: integrase, partial [Pseudomonadota bacterium]|nr:integrase [Pseudomonadota bacterium]
MTQPLPQPLEAFLVPAELDGRHGHNRASAGAARQLAADNDLQAIQVWLAEFRGSPRTQRHYRKEAERLLLWALLERGKALSSLTREDCLAYEDFLADPQPRPRWCGPKAPRFSPRWRPFRGPLSPSSRRTALLIVNSLFGYLVKAGYLAGNPLALRRRRDANSRQPQVERYLEQDQWQALLATVEEMPKDTPRQRRHYERTRFLVALLYLLAPRVSEVASHTMGSFVEVRGRWWWQVTGKGNREGRVPVNSDMLRALEDYRRSLGLPALPEPGETTPLVLSLNGTAG